MLFWLGIIADLASIAAFVITIVTLHSVRKIQRDVRAGSALADLPTVLDDVAEGLQDALRSGEIGPQLRERMIRMSEDVKSAMGSFDGQLAEGCRLVVRNVDRYGERGDRDSLNAVWEAVVRLHQRVEKERERRMIWRS